MFNKRYNIAGLTEQQKHKYSVLRSITRQKYCMREKWDTPETKADHNAAMAREFNFLAMCKLTNSVANSGNCTTIHKLLGY